MIIFAYVEVFYDTGLRHFKTKLSEPLSQVSNASSNLMLLHYFTAVSPRSLIRRDLFIHQSRRLFRPQTLLSLLVTKCRCRRCCRCRLCWCRCRCWCWTSQGLVMNPIFFTFVNRDLKSDWLIRWFFLSGVRHPGTNSSSEIHIHQPWLRPPL